MDYSKSSGPKSGKNTPRHREHNEPGSTKTPFGGKAATEKAALLARMKPAAEAKKKG